jgi:hypothetical protein
MKTAEQTRCRRPLRRRRICAASFKLAGLPRILFSISTNVSAARTIFCGCKRATEIPLRRALRSVSSRKVRPASNSSATLEGTLSNSKPAAASSSYRRGEAEAKSNRVATFRRQFTELARRRSRALWPRRKYPACSFPCNLSGEQIRNRSADLV